MTPCLTLGPHAESPRLARTLPLADGTVWSVTIPASLSVVLDEVLDRGIMPDQLLRDVHRDQDHHPSVDESDLLAALLIGLDEHWRDGMAELADFRAFCREHVQHADNRHKIRAEGARRKAAQRLIWFGE